MVQKEFNPFLLEGFLCLTGGIGGLDNKSGIWIITGGFWTIKRKFGSYPAEFGQ